MDGFRISSAADEPAVGTGRAARAGSSDDRGMVTCPREWMSTACASQGLPSVCWCKESVFGLSKSREDADATMAWVMVRAHTHERVRISASESTKCPSEPGDCAGAYTFLSLHVEFSVATVPLLIGVLARSRGMIRPLSLPACRQKS